MPVKPNIKTESPRIGNDEVKKLAGQLDTVKRDGSAKDIRVSFYDVDYAVAWHIENIIRPVVIKSDGVATPVPIVFANSERWAMIQRNGYYKDNQGKILAPVIIIGRTGLEKREDMQDSRVLESADSRFVFEKKYSANNYYNRFDLINKPREREFYSVDVPRYYNISYELVIWTDYTSELNQLIEQLLWYDGKAFGDTHKFTVFVEPTNLETSVAAGEDRIVRATLQLTARAYILNPQGKNAPAMYRLKPVSTLVIEESVYVAGEDPQPRKTPLTKTIATQSINSDSNVLKNPKLAPVIEYLNKNKMVEGTVSGGNTATFNAIWLSAPQGLPATNASNFLFYLNGVLLEPQYITAFTNIGSNCFLTLDTSKLGFNLDATDEITAIGKFL